MTTLARHSLELEHVPNCDTMQQGVAVVKPTGHKRRRQALDLVHVKIFSDSAQVADVIDGKFANICDMSRLQEMQKGTTLTQA